MTADRILYGFTIIMCIHFVSIIIVDMTHLLLPPPLLGMIILSLLLFFGIVKMEKLRDICFLLLDYMGMLFIPPAISVILYFDTIAKEFLPIFLTIVLSAVLVMVITGKVVQAMIERSGR